MDMSYIDAQEFLLLKLEAMRSVLRNDAGFTFRSICRWYSENYYTPLHEVGTPGGAVPMEEVLKTFYEVQYSRMDDAKKHEELVELVMTPEEEAELWKRADIKEAEDWTFARMYEQQEQKKKEQKQRLEEVKLREQKALTAKDEEPKQKPMPAARLDNGPPMPPPSRPPPPPAPRKAPKPLVQTELPEDVKVVFMTDEEMENEASLMDPFAVQKGAPPPKQSKK